MSREISHEEVKKHSDQSSTWMIIHHEIYDVTKFLDEHPGGADSLLEFAGQDGTQAFEDVGHSDDAREMMKKYKIGVLPASERAAPPCGFVPQMNREVIILPASSSCPKAAKDPSKPWRTFDGSRERSPSPKGRKTPCDDDQRLDRRVQAIVVPRERCASQRRRSATLPPQPPPPSGSRLKWALIALAGALIIGYTMKKYMGSS